MIIVDNAIKWCATERRPIGVALIGPGFMGRAVALQIATKVPAIRLVSIVTRNPQQTLEACPGIGIADAEIAETAGDLRRAFRDGKTAIMEDWRPSIESELVDVVLDTTGSLEYAAGILLQAIAHQKHVVLMNAELDGTIGPLLKRKADEAGVVYTNVDGDQPGVTMNLYRFVCGLGVTPVLCGNIKGLHDPYRTPETQKEFATRWGQKAAMVTSFADGTKVSFEQAIIANATGMSVGKRGMFGPSVPAGTPIETAAALFPASMLLDSNGIVDYVIGAAPAPGVFVLGTTADERQKHFLALYKLGTGPIYCFYTPYHLCHFEVPNTIARAALLGDATIAPIGAPRVDVVAAAKRDLRAGETLDDLGHFMTYGLCENAITAHSERLLPIGIAPGCRLTRDLPKDDILTYDDVVLPGHRLIDELRAEQDQTFFESVSVSEPQKVTA